MPDWPHYFQLSIFLYLLCVFLDCSKFNLALRYISTACLTKRRISIRTLLQILVLYIVRLSLNLSHWSAALSNTDLLSEIFIQVCISNIRCLLINIFEKSNSEGNLDTISGKMTEQVRDTGGPVVYQPTTKLSLHVNLPTILM